MATFVSAGMGRGACILDSLQRLGWNPFRQHELEQLNQPDQLPARVAAGHRGAYGVLGAVTCTAKLSGRLRHRLEAAASLPCVGDWVAVRPAGDIAIIEAVLPRHTLLSRRQCGTKLREQVVAANVDIVFIVSFGQPRLQSPSR
jgi:ribosome biogenesis GTPase